MSKDRLAGRVARLMAQMDRCAAKIRAHPEDPRATRCKARWLECRDSLENLRDHGRETLPGGGGSGIEIAVPPAPFTVERGEV